MVMYKFLLLCFLVAPRVQSAPIASGNGWAFVTAQAIFCTKSVFAVRPLNNVPTVGVHPETPHLSELEVQESRHFGNSTALDVNSGGHLAVSSSTALIDVAKDQNSGPKNPLILSEEQMAIGACVFFMKAGVGAAATAGAVVATGGAVTLAVFAWPVACAALTTYAAIAIGNAIGTGTKMTIDAYMAKKKKEWEDQQAWLVGDWEGKCLPCLEICLADGTACIGTLTSNLILEKMADPGATGMDDRLQNIQSMERSIMESESHIVSFGVALLKCRTDREESAQLNQVHRLKGNCLPSEPITKPADRKKYESAENAFNDLVLSSIGRAGVDSHVTDVTLKAAVDVGTEHVSDAVADNVVGDINLNAVSAAGVAVKLYAAARGDAVDQENLKDIAAGLSIASLPAGTVLTALSTLGHGSALGTALGLGR